MKQFKLRKVRIDIRLRRLIELGFIICIIGIVLIPIRISENNINVTEIKKEKINPEQIINNFKFNGQLQEKTLLDDKYMSLLYLNKNKYENHLINLVEEREIKIEDIIKKNMFKSFKNKINELLAYKYPNVVVKALKKGKYVYDFRDKYLNVYFYNYKINSERNFNLKVYYNEIKDLLKFNPIIEKDYQNEDGFEYDKNKMTVIFTFDDGPSGSNTEDIINALEEYKMSATFFMLGNKLESNVETVFKVSKSHSEIGYHSHAHTNYKTQSSEEIKNEFNEDDNYLYSLVGKHFKYTRPPYGAFNKEIIDAIPTPLILWNVDTNDWKYRDTEYLITYINDNINNDDLILFHDTYKETVEGIKKIVENLYLKDIQVLSVTNYTSLKDINIENNTAYFDFK